MREGVPRQRSQQAMFDLIDFLIQPSCQSVEVCFLGCGNALVDTTAQSTPLTFWSTTPRLLIFG